MKNINNNLRWSSRAGQIAPIAIVIGALIIGGVGGIFYFSLKKPSTPVPTTSTGCSALNPEQCAADEAAKNQAADEAKRIADLGITNDAVASPPANDLDFTRLDVSAGHLESGDRTEQVSLKNFWDLVTGLPTVIKNVFWEAVTGLSDYFLSRTPLPIDPIDLDSVPSSPKPTPTPAPKPAPTPAYTPTPTNISCFDSDILDASKLAFEKELSAYRTAETEYRKVYNSIPSMNPEEAPGLITSATREYNEALKKLETAQEARLKTLRNALSNCNSYTKSAADVCFTTYTAKSKCSNPLDPSCALGALNELVKCTTRL